MLFGDRFLTLADQHIAIAQETGIGLDLRIVFYQRGTDNGRNIRRVKDGAIDPVVRIEALDAVRLFIISVIIQFVGNKKRDEHADGQSDGQSRDINQREYRRFGQVAKRKEEIIFQHMGGVGSIPGSKSMPFLLIAEC